MFFDNWYSDAACTSLFDFNSAINADTKVYAKWRCGVTFVTDHGTAPETQIVDIGDTATKPVDLSWIGYIWAGWYSDTAWQNAFDFRTPIVDSTTLYAKWVPDLKITKGNGGTAHYGSYYAFTLNYYYPDYNINKNLFVVNISSSGGGYSLLSKDCYAVTQDSDKRVVVTLKASYIRTLTDGATYYILFDTGLESSPVDLGLSEGNFRVNKAPKTNQWVRIDGKWYYYDESGQILKNDWAKDSKGWCWLGSDGKQAENKWIRSNGAWYYIDGNGHRIENGWAKDSGGWCWLGSDGKQVENKWIRSSGAWYYIDGNGHRIENGWAKDSGGWCWLGSDGKQVENKWIRTGGAWYYIDGNGHRVENGWAKDSKGWCWLGSDGKQVENKWIRSSGAWYYIDGNGHRIENGWAKDSKGWCWLGLDGKQVENKWIRTGGAWYYIDGNGHRVENSWAKDSKGWCWLGADGKQIESRWIETGGKKYYIDANGHRVTGQQTINGKNYTFDRNGALIA